MIIPPIVWINRCHPVPYCRHASSHLFLLHSIRTGTTGARIITVFRIALFAKIFRRPRGDIAHIFHTASLITSRHLQYLPHSIVRTMSRRWNGSCPWHLRAAIPSRGRASQTSRNCCLDVAVVVVVVMYYWLCYVRPSWNRRFRTGTNPIRSSSN